MVWFIDSVKNISHVELSLQRVSGSDREKRTGKTKIKQA